jgi:hypothetical protein
MNRGSIYPSVKSSRTSSHNSEESTEGNTDEHLTLSLVKSPKTITICTLCGRYKGMRPVPKSSLLSFRTTIKKDVFFIHIYYKNKIGSFSNRKFKKSSINIKEI